MYSPLFRLQNLGVLFVVIYLFSCLARQEKGKMKEHTVMTKRFYSRRPLHHQRRTYRAERPELKSTHFKALNESEPERAAKGEVFLQLCRVRRGGGAAGHRRQLPRGRA